MKLSKRYKFGGRPKSFAVQLLLAVLTGSLVPLLLLSVFAGQTVLSQLQKSGAMSVARTEANYIHMYENNIAEQVQSIDSELRKVESAVLVAKSMAEAIFSDPAPYANPLSFVFDGERSLYYDPASGSKGEVTIRVDRESERPTPEQAQDFAISKALFPIFQSETAYNRNIVSMYYIHPHSGSFHYPGYEGPQELTPRKINKLTTYPFYTDALQIPPGANRVVWTKPYFDITPRGWMFTATTPVYDEQQRLKGIVAADVTIDNFLGNVVDTSFDNQDGYALLLDTDYHLIASQKHGISQINQMNLSAVFHTPEAYRTDNYRRLELNGEAKAVFSQVIPATNWTLGYVISEQKLLEPVYSATKELNQQTEKTLFIQLALLCGLAIALSIGLAFYLRSRIARPVNMLTEAFSRIGRGPVELRAGDTRVLEFNRLLYSFNRMAGKISELLEEQAQLNKELESKVQLRTIELREMNWELEERIGDLIRLEQWRKELFMNISHDLKTPITLIQGYIEAINDGTIPEAQIDTYLKRIHEGIRTITRLARNLNELSLLETRQLQADMKPLHSNVLFRSVKGKWEPYMELEKRRFAAEGAAADSFVQGDAHLLERVLDNLIENAIKYTGADCPIIFRYSLSDNAVQFSVIDAGPGIPRDEIPFIFDSFYRVDKSRNSDIPGSGLGLSIAKEIAAMHGGELSLRLNAPSGDGCTFTLSLPLYERPAASVEAG
ncbi:ATP-binding protein [Paenibacillus sp. NPDC058071]|uniref:sensor histidine kinase n=1 Tax=Paenibacillus sp. NPDC058071 TaxID=3346326 RepID=UPI0036DB75CA